MGDKYYFKLTRDVLFTTGHICKAGQIYPIEVATYYFMEHRPREYTIVVPYDDGPYLDFTGSISLPVTSNDGIMLDKDETEMANVLYG